MPTLPADPPTGAAGDPAGDLCGVVVLAGGGSRRWGGRDKTAALLGTEPVLAHVVRGVRTALGPAVPVVVVAPPEHPAVEALATLGGTAVVWTREEPPGGGPVAGLDAGVGALPDDVTVVAVTAGDVPFGGPALRRLLDAVTAARPGGASPDGDVDGMDGALAEDPDGRAQPLLAAYRTAPLRAAFAARPVTGRAVRDLVAGLRLLRVPVDAREALDLDAPEDLAAAAALVDR